MTPVAFVVAVIVGSALSPFAWIGAIYGAIKSRSWKLPIVLGAVGAALEVAIIAAFTTGPFDAGLAVAKVFAGIVCGLIVFGIAKLIRRGKPAAPPFSERL